LFYLTVHLFCVAGLSVSAESSCYAVAALTAVDSTSLSISRAKAVLVQVCRLDHLSVGQSVCLSGKCTVAKWLSESGCHLRWRVESVEAWVYYIRAVIIEGEEERVNLGHPIVTNGDFVAKLYESDALFPIYFGEDLFSYVARLSANAELSCTA